MKVPKALIDIIDYIFAQIDDSANIGGKARKMSKCCPSCEFMWLKTFPAPTRPVRAVSYEDNRSPPAGIYGRRVAAGFCTHTLELPGDLVVPPPKLVRFRTPGALIVVTGVSPSHPSIPFFCSHPLKTL